MPSPSSYSRHYPKSAPSSPSLSSFQRHKPGQSCAWQSRSLKIASDSSPRKLRQTRNQPACSSQGYARWITLCCDLNLVRHWVEEGEGLRWMRTILLSQGSCRPLLCILRNFCRLVGESVSQLTCWGSDHDWWNDFRRFGTGCGLGSFSTVQVLS